MLVLFLQAFYTPAWKVLWGAAFIIILPILLELKSTTSIPLSTVVQELVSIPISYYLLLNHPHVPIPESCYR